MFTLITVIFWALAIVACALEFAPRIALGAPPIMRRAEFLPEPATVTPRVRSRKPSRVPALRLVRRAPQVNAYAPTGMWGAQS